MATVGRRYPLLVYNQLFAMLRAPAFIIALLCGGLWWFAPDIPWLSSGLAQSGLLAITSLCALLFLYALIGPRMSYLQCFPDHLRISTPLYRVATSYGRIRNVRPTKFAPTDLKPSQTSLIEPLLGQTAVTVDLISYPVDERWLRLLLNQFLFPSDSTGFVFVTNDWMQLSREIDGFRGEWKMRRVSAQRTNS